MAFELWYHQIIFPSVLTSFRKRKMLQVTRAGK